MDDSAREGCDENWTCDCCGQRGRGSVLNVSCATAPLGFLWLCEACSKLHPHSLLASAFLLLRNSTPIGQTFAWQETPQMKSGVPIIQGSAQLGALCGDDDSRCECCLGKGAKPYTLLCFGVRIEAVRICRQCLKLATRWRAGHAVLAAAWWVLRNGKPIPQLGDWITKGVR